MRNELLEEEKLKEQEKEESEQKKSRSTLLWVLLVIILFLFLFTTILLGNRLFDLATRDQHTVDLGLGDLDGSIELFRIEYENEEGEITVQGLNADNVVAPGTIVGYDLRLRNNGDVVIDFNMTPTVDFFTEDLVPVEFKIKDDFGNYLLGSDQTWVGPDEMNALDHNGRIHPGEVFTYHVTWRWVFEVSDEQDAYDTYLGNIGGEFVPGVSVGIEVQASENPIPIKSNSHMMHLLGEGFGCCWCCWLVWILLLLLLIVLVRVWFLRRKLNKKIDLLEDYEEVLIKYGLLVDGELVERDLVERVLPGEDLGEENHEN